MSTAAYDNFFVRTLAGPGAFFLPAGALTTQHLATAKVVLRRYDVIMMLEKFDEDSVQVGTAVVARHTTMHAPHAGKLPAPPLAQR